MLAAMTELLGVSLVPRSQTRNKHTQQSQYTRLHPSQLSRPTPQLFCIVFFLRFASTPQLPSRLSLHSTSSCGLIGAKSTCGPHDPPARRCGRFWADPSRAAELRHFAWLGWRHFRWRHAGAVCARRTRVRLDSAAHGACVERPGCLGVSSMACGGGFRRSLRCTSQVRYTVRLGY